tara:strand:- start:3763 stop:4929 length:1167 start_codon:yes stop_codon:yes gene_type:complete
VDLLTNEYLNQVALFATLGFLSSLIITVSIIPFVHRIGVKYKILDIPNKRKTHKRSMVRLGGLSMIIAFLLGTLFIYRITTLFSNIEINNNIVFVILIGALAFFTLGIIDDIKRLKPFTKLFFQIIIANFIYLVSPKINAIDLNWLSSNLDPLILSNFITYFLTIFLIVAITNSINWLDGIDGLASGITLIIGLGLIIMFINQKNITLALITSTLCGTNTGFLRYNFYPAKILMGDGGSYLLGGTLSVISIVGLSYGYQINYPENLVEIGSITVLPLQTIIFLFFVPIVDMMNVIISRLASGYNPFYPDRKHIHHKMLDRGLPQRYTVIILYSIAQFGVMISLYTGYVQGKIIILCISLIMITLSALYCLNMKRYLDMNYKKYYIDEK